ncbi:MAG TPA: NAD(P)H-dependent oxidoreductase, partial [Polyangiaceae bacterium]|nr:NAD(P)H-dependent oxidoreductase [Polyangiaceae bacterium]
ATLLLLNGSVRGSTGNTARLLERAHDSLPKNWQIDTLALAEYDESVEALSGRLVAADALLLGTGVYWGSWGSPLQRFLEVISAYELSPCFLGKPVAAAVTADSVGGLDVAQRLLGAFSLLGCLVPPLSTLVVSRVGNAATLADARENEDVWQTTDLDVVVQNLCIAHSLRGAPWATWPVRKLPRVDGAYPAHGVLDAGMDKFL